MYYWKNSDFKGKDQRRSSTSQESGSPNRYKENSSKKRKGHSRSRSRSRSRSNEGGRSQRKNISKNPINTL